MITVRFYRKKGPGSVHMALEGHAGAGPKGEDLVCAGASVLAYTAGQAVQFLWEQGKLRCKPRIALSQGSGVIIATPKAEFAGEVLYLFWVIQAGIYVLARNYPGCVRLKHLEITEEEG